MYGKVEVRAQLPTGAGTWPAIWMLAKDHSTNGSYWSGEYGTTPWPDCGEIDIMEHWGTNQDYVSSAMHTRSSHGATVNKGGRTVPGVSSGFHVYALEWTPEKMVFSIDDIVHYTYNPAPKNKDTWPFDKEFYILLNVAILPVVSADFSESPMIIDYVRVYQKSNISSVQSAEPKVPVVYPNPFQTGLSIHLPEFPEHSVNLEMYNSRALLVRTMSFPASGKVLNLEDVDDLPGGIYLVSFEINSKFYRSIVFKQ
jgi:beta-glucanase (GH16 family)